VSAPGDYDNGEIGGMIGRGNRSFTGKYFYFLQQITRELILIFFKEQNV
jgi:hypothetical protein